MDIGKAFAFVFEDEDWIVKILIAAAILFAGILLSILVIPAIVASFLLGGYGIEITRRVIRGDSPVLPEWDNWGDLLVDGIKAWIIGLVYALPIIIVGICVGIPAGILGENAEELSALLGIFSSCLTFLWLIPMGLLLPAATAAFVAEDDLSAAFRFGDVFALVRDNFATYVIVLVLGVVANMIGFLGFVLCFLPVLVTGPYANWVNSHLYGQAYLEAKGQVSAPVAEDWEEEIA